MIIAGTLMLPGDRAVRLAEGWLRVAGERIAEVHPGPCPRTVDLGGPGALIAPGFIDAHVHIPQFDSIGVDGLTLLDWLHRAVFPAEARWADASYAADMTARVARRLLAHGTTGVGAYATVHHEAAAAALRVLAEAGLRGIIGQVMMDQQAPADLCRPARQLAREVESMASVGRMEPAVTPRFAVACSAELLSLAGEVARRRNWCVQTHLSETRDECELVKRLHGVERYLDAYARAGLVTARSVFAHGICLDERERAQIAGAGATVAHCPTSNTFLQSGIMDRGALLGAGARLGLGSDVAGGPDVSMPRVARAMIDAAKHRRMMGDAQAIPTPAEAWWQITAGNAAALGLRGGTLSAGEWADVLVIHPGAAWRETADPLGLVLYGWDERWLTRTVAGGRVAVQGPW